MRPSASLQEPPCLLCTSQPAVSSSFVGALLRLAWLSPIGFPRCRCASCTLPPERMALSPCRKYRDLADLKPAFSCLVTSLFVSFAAACLCFRAAYASVGTCACPAARHGLASSCHIMPYKLLCRPRRSRPRTSPTNLAPPGAAVARCRALEALERGRARRTPCASTAGDGAEGGHYFGAGLRRHLSNRCKCREAWDARC